KGYVQFGEGAVPEALRVAETLRPPNAFPAGSYAKAYVKGAAKPQEFVNTLASGAVYSTADDMARIAMMFLSGGRVGTTRILSAASVADMAADQTKIGRASCRERGEDEGGETDETKKRRRTGR